MYRIIHSWTCRCWISSSIVTAGLFKTCVVEILSILCEVTGKRYYTHKRTVSGVGCRGRRSEGLGAAAASTAVGRSGHLDIYSQWESYKVRLTEEKEELIVLEHAHVIHRPACCHMLKYLPVCEEILLSWHAGVKSMLIKCTRCICILIVPDIAYCS